ncbi:tRNA 2'-phosphotransferase 1-like protein [Carex littledalei]|uniref:2'-phosphotransferase n=1 Tax=Carex littledalei TaxID=544730 RepID=A0A833RAU6_9POAL|nr:tRNA 2'-phosphotransferase 1-like protein [Carex littledalei]
MWTLSLTHSTSLRAIFSLLSFSPRSPFFPSSRFSLLSSSPRPPLSMESHPSSSRPSKPFSTMGYAPRGGGRGRGRGRGGGGGRSNTDGESSRIDALGRLLTRILRHMASELNLNMRSDGYVRVNDLLNLNIQTFAKIPLKSHTVEEVREAVRRDNKQRFSLLEEDGQLFIRANQGHTIKAVESEHLLKPIMSAEEVPVCLHGTYKRNLESILKSGLKRMERLHVHFSSGLPTDGEVVSGMRRDINILIYLDVKKALEDGMKLYVSDNKVILTEGFDGVVPVKYFAKIETWPRRELLPFQF